MILSRREFVAVGGRALACASVGSAAGAAGCAAARGARSPHAVGKPRFHVFSKMFQPPVTKSPEELCDLMAGAGCDGVQWTVRKGGHVVPEDVKIGLPRLVKVAAARGLAVETICTGITDGNDPSAETVLRVAADCGVRQFRAGYLFYDGTRETFAQSMDRFRRSFASLASLAGRCGVRAAYQNHSTWGPPVFGGTVWDLHEVLRDLDPHEIGVEYDPMHAYFETYESWRNGFSLVAPWIASVDLKDFHYTLSKKDPKRMAKRMVAAGEGIVPWADVKRLVGKLGVDPLYIVHFEYDFDKTNLTQAVRREVGFFKSTLQTS